MTTSRPTHGWESMRPVPGRTTVMADASGRSLRGTSNSEMKAVIARDENAAPERQWTAYVEYGDDLTVRVTGPTHAALERRLRQFSESILRSWTATVTKSA